MLRYDQFKVRVESYIEGTINLMFSFLRQNDGHFSNRALSNRFKALEEGEVSYVEKGYAEAFGN